MRIVPFGKTGINVSEYGLGTWAMGGGIYGVVDDNESISTIHRAAELGINFLDTAPMYGISDGRDGRAEEVIGRAIHGQRDRWILGTKFGRHLTSTTTMDEDYSGAQAARSLEQSLLRMNTDYVDVLFVHSPPAARFDPRNAFDGMARLKEQGKIRVIGYSFWELVADTYDLVEPYLREGIVEAIQVKYSLLVPEPLERLIPLVRETGTAVVAREALAQGFLTDSFTAESRFGDQDFKSHISKDEIQKKLNRASDFRFLVKPQNGIHTLPAAALHWLVSQPEVTIVIPGSKTVAELEQCLVSADIPYYENQILMQTGAVHASWTT